MGVTTLPILWSLVAFNTIFNLALIASCIRNIRNHGRTIAACRSHDAAQVIDIPATGATFVFPIDEDRARTPAYRSAAMAATATGPTAETYYRLGQEYVPETD